MSSPEASSTALKTCWLLQAQKGSFLYSPAPEIVPVINNQSRPHSPGGILRDNHLEIPHLQQKEQLFREPIFPHTAGIFQSPTPFPLLQAPLLLRHKNTHSNFNTILVPFPGQGLPHEGLGLGHLILCIALPTQQGGISDIAHSVAQYTKSLQEPRRGVHLSCAAFCRWPPALRFPEGKVF